MNQIKREYMKCVRRIIHILHLSLIKRSIMIFLIADVEQDR